MHIALNENRVPKGRNEWTAGRRRDTEGKKHGCSLTGTPKRPSCGTALPQLSQCHSGRHPFESGTSTRVYGASWPRNTASKVAMTQGTLLENQRPRRGKQKACDASERSMQSFVLGQTKEARGVAVRSRDESSGRGNQRGRGLQRRGAMSVGDGMRASQEFNVRHALRTKV